jgi:hypothetical protein
MLMRFHWSLAVGHTYTHDSTLNESFAVAGELDGEMDLEQSGQHLREEPHDLDLSEFSLTNRDNDDWDALDGEEDGEIDYPQPDVETL